MDCTWTGTRLALVDLEFAPANTSHGSCQHLLGKDPPVPVGRQGGIRRGCGGQPQRQTARANPPGTSHTPYSVAGCTLFVKLWQFAPDDLHPVRVDTRQGSWQPGLVPGLVPGLSVLPLHQHGSIGTALVRWAPNTRFGSHEHPGDEEIYVLEGRFHDEHGTYPAGGWLRSPHWSRHQPHAGPEGAPIYVETGHLGASSTMPPGRGIARAVVDMTDCEPGPPL